MTSSSKSQDLFSGNSDSRGQPSQQKLQKTSDPNQITISISKTPEPQSSSAIITSNPSTEITILKNKSIESLDADVRRHHQQKNFHFNKKYQSSITGRLKPYQVYLSWDFLFWSLLAHLTATIAIVVIILVSLCQSQWSSLNTPIWSSFHYLQWLNLVAFLVFLFATQVTYLFVIIYWHPLRKVWFNWRPKPTKFKEVYSLSESIQVISHMSLVHKILLPFLFIIDLSTLILLILYDPFGMSTTVFQTLEEHLLNIFVVGQVFLFVFFYPCFYLWIKNMKKQIILTQGKKTLSSNSSNPKIITVSQEKKEPTGLTVYTIRWIYLVIIAIISIPSILFLFSIPFLLHQINSQIDDKNILLYIDIFCMVSLITYIIFVSIRTYPMRKKMAQDPSPVCA